MDLVLSLVMLSAFVLLGGAVYLWRRGGARKQVTLMAVLAVVMLVNVAIWALPGSDGNAPIDQVDD